MCGGGRCIAKGGLCIAKGGRFIAVPNCNKGGGESLGISLYTVPSIRAGRWSTGLMLMYRVGYNSSS